MQAKDHANDCQTAHYLPTRVESLPNFDRVNAAPRRNRTRETEIDTWWQSSCHDYRTERVPKARSKNLICRIQGQQPAVKPTYTLEFVAFAAEEPGMLGSKSYLAQQSLPVIAMINLDTLGLRSIIIAGESDRALACQNRQCGGNS